MQIAHAPVAMAPASCVFQWLATSLASGSSGFGALSSACAAHTTHKCMHYC